MANFDYLIIGSGIVGLATAMRLLERYPGARVGVVEKENQVAAHQSSHNSGVIHAGVYYEPGSLKAILCGEGIRRTREFCQEYSIPFQQPGKLIVATNNLEVQRLAVLHERARRNGVVCEMLSVGALREREPNVTGIAAMLVQATGIVDYAEICKKMAQIIQSQGALVQLGALVTGIYEDPKLIHVETSVGTFSARQMVACTGLQSDRIARLANLPMDFAIIPFRGDFYRLAAHRSAITDHLIYPVPDPGLPFLGVHLTPTIGGEMTVGPSAMLAFAREGYTKWSRCARDVREMLRYPGLWRLLAKYPRAGGVECLHTVSRRAYLRAVQKYCPILELADLEEQHCGIRAQAVSHTGQLIHDFVIKRTPRSLHICNAPSPAATAALPIADVVIDQI